MDEMPRPDRIATPAIDPSPTPHEPAPAATAVVQSSAAANDCGGPRGELPKAGAALDVGACSDVGRARENNEDSLALAPELHLFVVSDGIGGQSSGEVASQLTTKTIVAHLRETRGRNDVEMIGEPIRGATETSNRLVNAIRFANREVRRAAEMNFAWRGMGATVVALQFDNGRVSIAHVGDSRAYRLRGGQLEQLTRDHSFVAEQVRQGTMTQQEAEKSRLQNVLMRALGTDPRVEVDLNEELAIDGDALLLCSDGLTRELTDAQIAAVVDESATSQQAADRLVDLANQAGGADNITVIVVRYGERPGGTLAKLGRWFKGPKK